MKRKESLCIEKPGRLYLNSAIKVKITSNGADHYMSPDPMLWEGHVVIASVIFLQKLHNLKPTMSKHWTYPMRALLRSKCPIMSKMSTCWEQKEKKNQSDTKPKDSCEIGGKRKTLQINAKYDLGLEESSRKRVTGKSDWWVWIPSWSCTIPASWFYWWNHD